jgi:hypothetical protein
VRLLSLNRLGIGLKTIKAKEIDNLAPAELASRRRAKRNMEKNQMVVRKRVEGQVEYNDGDFAEVQTIGIEGIEKNLLLETIQIHRGDTQDTPQEFRHRFPVGVRLAVLTTTEVTKKSVRRKSLPLAVLGCTAEEI